MLSTLANQRIPVLLSESLEFFDRGGDESNRLCLSSAVTDFILEGNEALHHEFVSDALHSAGISDCGALKEQSDRSLRVVVCVGRHEDLVDENENLFRFVLNLSPILFNSSDYSFYKGQRPKYQGWDRIFDSCRASFSKRVSNLEIHIVLHVGIIGVDEVEHPCNQFLLFNESIALRGRVNFLFLLIFQRWLNELEESHNLINGI
mmetsp:Transcript_536/g.900  ORF Transcript_536/g.900 Transcript_536/m.900 type:complete len:205 (+) Transcript_536:672-1286(+)